jgi:hypothetical protein
LTRTRIGGALAAVALLLAACGGGGEAGKSPSQILDDAANALQSAKSVHIDATSTGGSSGTFHITVDLVSGGGARGSVTSEGVVAKFVVAGGKFYIQGRDFFAKFAGPQAATVIGDRWVLIPSNAGVSSFESFTDTKTLADCLRADHGTLSSGGTATVAGQGTVVLVDKGDRPGTAPGKLYVASSGTAYPLELQVTGATSSGTPPGGAQCAGTTGGSATGGSSSGGAGTLFFSQYDASVSVTPPANPLDLSSLAG